MAKKKSYRVMSKFRISHISAVDRPAQEGAVATIMKRDESDEFVKSPGAVITGSSMGHSHIFNLFGFSGLTSMAKTVRDDQEFGGHHSHPFVLDVNGKVTIGEADDHTHSVDRDMVRMALRRMPKTIAKGDDVVPRETFEKMLDFYKFEGDEREEFLGAYDERLAADDDGELGKEKEMPKDRDDAVDATAEIKKANEDAAYWKTVAGLNPKLREYYNGLAEDDQRNFIAKSDDERENLVKSANVDNPVVYTALDGAEFRKNDDERLIAMAKRADESERRMAKAEASAKMAEFTKRAENELGQLPGHISTHVAVIQALDGIEDAELRKGAFELVKAANDSFDMVTKTIGSSGGMTDYTPNENTVEGRLDAMAGEIQKRDGGTFEEAYTKAIQTREGTELYTQLYDSRQ